jgi:hypothetical protein
MRFSVIADAVWLATRDAQQHAPRNGQSRCSSELGFDIHGF